MTTDLPIRVTRVVSPEWRQRRTDQRVDISILTGPFDFAINLCRINFAVNVCVCF